MSSNPSASPQARRETARAYELPGPSASRSRRKSRRYTKQSQIAPPRNSPGSNFCSEFERDSFISRKRVRSRIRGCFRGCAREPRVSRPTRGAGAPALQVDRTTHEGIGPTHVQNSAEDYQKTQRTIKLTRGSSLEPGSATRQRDPALTAVPQRYPRPSRSSKKNSFSHPPISQRGRT